RCPTRRAALPCPSRRPAGSATPSHASRVALLAAAPPCPARAPPCWPPHRPSLPARRPASRRTALPCPCAALLAAALPCQDNVSLFDHISGASLAPPDTANNATRSQWLTHDAAARLDVRNHLPLAERAHFGQHKTTKATYDAVVARYSSPATTTLGRLILPYPFPELSTFATVEDHITHLCTSDTRYRATLTAELLDKNPPPMYITLYFLVTRLPDSLRVVRDHFLALDPTDCQKNERE
ncbi:unnamed protein product, partial [Closterium sp. NIES-53]